MMTYVAWYKEEQRTVQGLHQLGVYLSFPGVLVKPSQMHPTFLSILAILLLITPLPQPRQPLDRDTAIDCKKPGAQPTVFQ